jgi:hypothetical protein
VGISIVFEAALALVLEVAAASDLDDVALLEDFLVSFALSFSLGASFFSFSLSFPSVSASLIGVVLGLAAEVAFDLPLRFVTMAGRAGFGFSFSFFPESCGGCGGFLGTSAGIDG